MRKSRWKALLRKSTSACVAAIEIYNKPTSVHREETFATLAVCAWEGLLKARLIKEAGNKISSIYVYERRKTKAGMPTQRLKIKVNRCGNPMTIGIEEAMKRVKSLPGMPLDDACKSNLLSLIEIRDNAIHFMNEDRDLAQRTHEAGTACLSNYVTAVREWFGEGLGDHRFSILPLSFEAVGRAEALRPPKRPQQAARLAAFLNEAAKVPESTGSGYAASLHVEVSIVGKRTTSASPVRLTTDPNAPAMVLEEADIARQFPLTYSDLQTRLRRRIPGFTANRAFNRAMKSLKQNPRLAHERRLNPRSAKTAKTWFYSDAMVDAVAHELSVGGSEP